MSKPVLSVDAVLEWAKSKDPKEEFSPCQGLTCALAQYGMHLGIPFAVGGSDAIHEMDEAQNMLIRTHKIRNMPSYAIYHKMHTKGTNNFGNLVEALEQHLTAYPTAAF